MKSNATLLTVALIVIAAGMYWYFFTGTTTDNQLPLTAGPENRAQTIFQTLVGELRPISFDTSIFSDPRFNALVDLTTPVAPETTGRLDPFAPVAGIGGN